MARLVRVSNDTTLDELRDCVLKEFGKGSSEFTLTLSYWPPTTRELATGIRTPPVLLTNDVVIPFFRSHSEAGAQMNLFAKFETVVTGRRLFDGVQSEDPFLTPAVGLRRSMFGTGGFSNKGGLFSSGASRASVADEEETELVREVEKVEASVRSKNMSFKGKEVETGNVDIDKSPSDVDERDVRPRGYDHEFWAPLIRDQYGGSDAVDVVFNDAENPSRTYRSTNNNVSEPGVVDGEPSVPNVDSDPNPEGVKFPWSANPGHEHVDTEPPLERRSLDEIRAEEFDIPPLFDDTAYEVEEIPDLDAVEDGGLVYVGKTYGSKEDCQISLAIYAIKQQFLFKQTVTKLNYFVVECPHERCDWRVAAHEKSGYGYYEIRKAQLDHKCPIEFRNGYKKKVTSRVIAAVYKSKFADRSRIPKAKELQKLVLEDLRIDASYIKCYRAIEHGTNDALL